MRTAVIPVFWLGIANSWSAHTLLALDDAVRCRNVNPMDRAAVAQVWAQTRAKRRKRSVSKFQRWRRRH